MWSLSDMKSVVLFKEAGPFGNGVVLDNSNDVAVDAVQCFQRGSW